MIKTLTVHYECGTLSGNDGGGYFDIKFTDDDGLDMVLVSPRHTISLTPDLISWPSKQDHEQSKPPNQIEYHDEGWTLTLLDIDWYFVGDLIKANGNQTIAVDGETTIDVDGHGYDAYSEDTYDPEDSVPSWAILSDSNTVISVTMGPETEENGPGPINFNTIQNGGDIVTESTGKITLNSEWLLVAHAAG